MYYLVNTNVQNVGSIATCDLYSISSSSLLSVIVTSFAVRKSDDLCEAIQSKIKNGIVSVSKFNSILDDPVPSEILTVGELWMGQIFCFTCHVPTKSFALHSCSSLEQADIKVANKIVPM